jgi:uncharacterized protein YndB with AHSA1/START domain
MHSPDGVHFPNESVFQDIAQPERIVFKHLAPVHEFLATAEFAEDRNGTTIRFTMLSLLPLSARDRGAMWRGEMKRIWTACRRFWPRPSETTIRSGTKGGMTWQQQLRVRLVGDREIAINRIFDAPRERVFAAWI